jgi:spermidine synthase
MRRYLYFTVFASGMTSLAAEFCASRLLGNVFGTSNLVWAAIIGLILIYLAAGYFLGGRWADRSPHPQTLYSILAWGAFTLGIVPHIAQPVLRAAADAFDGLQVGVLLGSFLAVLILFSVPVTLLGMVSPFAIRLSMDDARRAGNVAGGIYAISTLGSFIGTYLPVLALIPTIGTTNTFLVFSIFLLCVALAGLGLSGARKRLLLYLLMVAALAAAALFGGRGGIKKTAGQIYEAESAYNYIQVLELDGYRYLRLNEGQGVHSIYSPATLDYGGPWQQFLAGPFFYADREPTDVSRIAILGLAAGTTARQATAVFPNVVMDGFEIDPAILQVGRDYFGMNLPNLNAIAQDARWGLANSRARYDLIGVDAYRPPYIPWHLTTQEFFQIAADHLTDEGALVINVAHTPGDRRLIEGLATTIGTIFPSIYVMDIPGTFNAMIYATLQPTEAANLERNLAALAARAEAHPLLLTSLSLAWDNLQSAPQRTTVFTDDLAPIEWITNDMVLNFVLHGEIDTLQ